MADTSNKDYVLVPSPPSTPHRSTSTTTTTTTAVTTISGAMSMPQQQQQQQQPQQRRRRHPKQFRNAAFWLVALSLLGLLLYSNTNQKTLVHLNHSYYLRRIHSHNSHNDNGSTSSASSFPKRIISDKYPVTPFYHHSSDLLQEPRYLLNDKTIRLSPHVKRPWLDIHNAKKAGLVINKEEKPPMRLILTQFGWNHKNQTHGLIYPRYLHSRELLQAFVDHPYFDPTVDWHDDVESGRHEIDPDTQYVVLLDVETCFDANYPVYGGTPEENSDIASGRAVAHEARLCYGIDSCWQYFKSVIHTPLFQPYNVTHSMTKTTQDAVSGDVTTITTTTVTQSPKPNRNTLLYIDCEGDGPGLLDRLDHILPHQLTIAAISATRSQLLLLNYSSQDNNYDMGLPPPAVHPIRLTPQQIQAIDEQWECHNNNNNTNTDDRRPYLVNFIGNTRAQARQDILKLHSPKNGIVMLQPHELEDDPLLKGETFASLLTKSKFAATPRGDNLFSYRFTEVLSAGAIPVVLADDWALPFRPELVDWERDCAIVLPEKAASHIVELLQDIPPRDICRRRKNCYDIYRTYMVNPEAQLEGLLQSIQAVNRKTPKQQQ